MLGDAFFFEASKRPPFSRLHPKVASFFRDYLSREKVVRFKDRYVLNTHFPPYPSKAFDGLVEQFNLLGDSADRRLYSVTLAMTNRCTYNCWHCYNADRSQVDLPLDMMRKLARQLQKMGAVMITLTGGEPLLRSDLEKIAGSFDERRCLVLGTTGDGLDKKRARRLREKGVFAVGVSLDSTDEVEHDRLRGKDGAFKIALDALRIAGENGLYPYIVAVATREFLRPDCFFPFMEFARDAGALEVHLLEPSATGKLAGKRGVLLTKKERQMVLDYQEQVAKDENLPILSTFLYLESPEAFGCGAGLTHLYIDGSGEVCPCNLVPLSFGNVTREPLDRILARMGCYFQKPRTVCVGRVLAKHVPDGQWPVAPALSAGICANHLPREHPLPRFFKVRSEAKGDVGRSELREAYDKVHEDYDDFWLTEAAQPIDDLVTRIDWRGDERVFEAGCGTGYGTALLAGKAAEVLAVDLSPGMLTGAQNRIRDAGFTNVQFIAGDALEILEQKGNFDVVFSSWVLGYIPLRPFFDAARKSLKEGGRLALVVHRENSPREPLEIFAELVARDPSVLRKRVAFDFPRDLDHVREEMAKVKLTIVDIWEGEIVFRYRSPEDVLEHLLKSGAGTAFYDAIDPKRRPQLTDEFLRILAERNAYPDHYDVRHEYVGCVATKV
jgi:MoaA/NifB/PqqE/SkfB family radical SAM enzyme/protein-L-isoaspartate O-methyltransferase